MTAARKHHLRNTQRGGPTCAGPNARYRGEHISLPYAEFIGAPESIRCERCADSKLFAFLRRSAGKATKTA